MLLYGKHYMLFIIVFYLSACERHYTTNNIVNAAFDGNFEGYFFSKRRVTQLYKRLNNNKKFA